MIIAVVVVVNDDDVFVNAAKVILKVLRKYIELAKNMVLKFNSNACCSFNLSSEVISS